MKKELPIFRAFVSEDDASEREVNFIALVDKPAIESNFLQFSAAPLKFTIENEEERIITGLAMVADLPIYRNDDGGEYFVFFDAQSIKTIALKFFRKQYNFNLNLQHNANAPAEGVYIFESWIVDREKGKFPLKQFENISNGSWIVSAKVDNEKIWQDIKEGKFNGFSVEGIFGMKRVDTITENERKFEDEKFLKKLKELLQDADL